MPDPLAAGFVAAYVVGVTPGKWARVWGERLPQHPLELRMMSPADALAALDDGSADVALLRAPVVSQRFSAIPLYEEQPVVVVAKDHEFEALTAVTIEQLTREIVLEQEWPAAVDLVATGAGVAVMPHSVARALSRKDVISRPVTDAATTEIALVWVTAGTTPLVEEFIGIVRGRTANSSRGTPTLPTEKPAAKPERTKTSAKISVKTANSRKSSKSRKSGKPRARKPKLR